MPLIFSVPLGTKPLENELIRHPTSVQPGVQETLEKSNTKP